MSLTPLVVGGVPEFVNYPFHHAKDSGKFSDSALDITWRDYTTGTGAMTRDLDDGVLDAAVLLTEGAVAAISKGSKFQILNFTVSSPLLWGIHVPVGAGDLSQLRRPRFAISRHGSGSHLMAFVLAQQYTHWEGMDFVVVNNMPGAVEAFKEGRADVFLWERFTTQPCVDAGLMKRLDVVPTTWPPFCLVASAKIIQNSPVALRHLLEAFHTAAQEVACSEHFVETISKFYNLQESQVSELRPLTQWNKARVADLGAIATVIKLLADLAVITSPITAEDCVFAVVQE